MTLFVIPAKAGIQALALTPDSFFLGDSNPEMAATL